VLLLGGKNSYESIKRYEDKAYDKVLVRFPKGKKDIIKAHAEAHSESVNGFINRAIDEAIERDGSAPAASEGQGEG
jgi:predicted HicB family RNase H-like nuclease